MAHKKHWLPHIVVVGGGFGGIRAALDLSKKVADQARITLVSKNPNFEYYPGLHTIIGECRKSVTEIPLKEIFNGSMVRVLTEAVTSCDPEKRIITIGDGKTIEADYLVLALGSQTEYFGIEGLPEMSFGLKSVEQAVRLRNHIDNLFKKYSRVKGTERVVGLHFVIVGAGAAGVDLAGELAERSHVLCKAHGIENSSVTIDVIEASPRVLPMMSERVSHAAERRLRTLGVNILLNRNLIKEGSWTVFLEDMKIGTKTLIWTAGLTTNEFYSSVKGFTLAKKKRVKIDSYLQAKPFKNVFIVGDAADTPYSGLAQTALHDGEYVAQTISARIHNQEPSKYVPRSVAYNIGVGPGWSIMVLGPLVITGALASWMRHLIDFKFFLSILPVGKVWKLFKQVM